jgi:hypothetical protein
VTLLVVLQSVALVATQVDLDHGQLGDAARLQRRHVDAHPVRRSRLRLRRQHPLGRIQLGVVLVGVRGPPLRSRSFARLNGLGARAVEHEDGPVLEVVVRALWKHELGQQALVVRDLLGVLMPEDGALVDVELGEEHGLDELGHHCLLRACRQVTRSCLSPPARAPRPASERRQTDIYRRIRV